jgi:anti-sigma factor RsiW
MTGHDRHAGDRLAALVDGRLDPAERERVMAHLAGCAKCRADYDTQLALKGVLGELRNPGAPSDLQARLARLPVTPPGEDGSPSRRQRMSAHRRAAVAGVAAGSMAVITLGTAYAVGGEAGEPVVPQVGRYMTDHAAVTSDIPLVQPQLSQLTTVRTPFLPGVTTTVVRVVPAP